MPGKTSKVLWIAKLSVLKMREGPVPWLRAVRRGLFDAMPPAWKATLARRRLSLPKVRCAAVAMPGCRGVERGGLVSVVLPVHEQASLLGASIESVLAQTHRDFELIVVDDGSSAVVGDVLARYERHPQVRLLRQEHLGLACALSNGFRFARGEFRTWTSADNIMEPQHLERMVAFLRERRDAAMVYGDYLVIDAHGRPLCGSDFRPQNRSSPRSAEVRIPRSTEALNVLLDNFIGPCFLYRGWVGRAIGDYRAALGVEDYDYWMRVNAHFTIQHLGTDELLYRYRWHGDSLNARARELGLFELGTALVKHERARALRRAEPWTLLVDAPARAAIGAASPHRVADWTGVVPPGAGKTLVLLDAGAAALPRTEDGVAVGLLWGDDPELVYRRAHELRRTRCFHLTCDAGVAEALALFTDSAFRVDRGELLELALVCASEALEAAEEPPAEAPLLVRARSLLPRVWRPQGRRRRVLLQADDFVEGGLERVVLALASGLRERGFDPTLLVLGRRGPAADAARAAGIPLAELSPRVTAEGHDRLLARFDLVHAHHSTFGAAQAHQRGVPFVQTMHNTYVWLYPDDVERYRRADAATDAYVCVSADVALYAHRRLGLSPGKSLVLPNGIDAPADAGGNGAPAARLRAELGLGSADFVFLNVAAVYPPKAQRVLAAALALARSCDASIKAVVLGRTMDAGYAAELRGDIERLGLEDALLLAGHRQDPWAAYRMADAFVLPSFWEGCSLALAEAVASGLPVVASDVGAARQQLVHGHGELVAPPFRSIADLDFTNHLGVCRSVPDDYARRIAAAMVAVAARGRQRVESAQPAVFDVSSMVDRHATLYDWLLGGGAAAGARPWMWDAV